MLVKETLVPQRCGLPNDTQDQTWMEESCLNYLAKLFTNAKNLARVQYLGKRKRHSMESKDTNLESELRKIQ